MDLAEELDGSDVLVNSLHPGSFMDTNTVSSHGFPVRTTVAEAADAVMHLVVGENVGSGEFYEGLNLAQANDFKPNLAAAY